jgi:hypothetical protein
MHLARHPWRFTLPAIALAGLAVVAGCTMVGDLTGVRLDLKANPSSCVRNCALSFADQVKTEAETHQTAVRGCADLPESDRESCRAAEAARHAAAMQQISSGRQECMNGCHRQGSGSAG